MSDSISVSSPVKVITDSSARVALDLMDRISVREKATDAQKESREYWLTLFHQRLYKN